MLDVPAHENFSRGPPRPTVVRLPGVPALGLGVERYMVPGGGIVAIDISKGDRLTLTDLEGRQPCELIAFDSKGNADPAILGAKANSIARGLKSRLSSNEDGIRRVQAGLARRNTNLRKIAAVRLFGTDTPAGETADFKIRRKGSLLVWSRGRPMLPHSQNSPTPIQIMVHRARITPDDEAALPEPLADPLHDKRIRKATAEPYVVRAGEFIQVIDVSGRQCTDFQCFSARKLDKGLERPLDATTTRAMVAQGYPSPGLYSKCFDQDMDPLVEVIRDTCGRHDAFLLACTARYYEDMGYPGHANCTDNFNGALQSYGVSARDGWMALNFFYNTAIDENNVVYFDEPWSRPGDYVLLRAMTDLVCVSSACPCDVDAANGWNPTDIHVRTYSDKQSFSRAVVYRMTPDADPELTRETAFHSRFAERTENFTEYRGFWLATRFNNEGPTEEYWACRERAIVTDLSPLRKFEIIGPDAEALMQYTLTRNVRKLGVGQVVYSAMCFEHGGMIDDGTLFRLGQDNFRWIGGEEYGGVWLREQAEKLGLKVWVQSSTSQLHNIAVQGPKSRDILKEIIWTAPAQTTLEKLGWFRFTIGRIGGFKGVPVVVSRTGYTGELGYEIWCHPNDAPAIFDAVWEAGEPHGISPMGLEALDMVRIEAGLIFAGYEFCDQTDPFEAGIGFSVALKTNEEDFIGREALVRRKQNPQKKLVGLEIQGNESAGKGDAVYAGRAQVGQVTSGMRSPILKKTIALARLDVTHTGFGSKVEIGKLDGHQKRLIATVVPFPHYDPKKTRVRA